MKEQADFFSQSHKRLLNFAIWAKYLAWIVLVINIFYVIGTYIQAQYYYDFYSIQRGQFLEFSQMLGENLAYTFGLLVEMLNILFRGIVYFLLLKGISLGLNMIVETDINYRENREQGNAS